MHKTTNPDSIKAFLKGLYERALAPALPKHAMCDVQWPQVMGRTYVLAAGKAATQMAAAIYDRLPEDAAGLIVTRQGYAQADFAPHNFRIVSASHPVPDTAGADAAQLALAAADGLGEDDLLLVLMSGGASALLPAPAEGISLAEKQAVTRALLHSGAPIGEMNIVRKHLSAIKGGRLAARAWPAATHMLAISDIPGDDIAMIGSGPSVADLSTCADALAIIDHYAIAIPPAIRAQLEQGALETPKPDDPRMQTATAEICARPADMCAEAAAAVTALGYEAIMLGDALEGEAAQLGAEHAKLALQLQAQRRKAALVSGGEATVTVRNRDGRGGRCSAYMLACALALNDAPGIIGFAADSDGIDGSEDNAGAYLWPGIVEQMGGAAAARQQLESDNSYAAFARADGLLMTGPSGTNVNDLRILLIG
ncbi:glycerate kinase type-2 family protein [Parasphingorhabdus cellanae]|uniref:Glycerate kinase n=1 Tax=Parasphingorhabdus cellanae TaxID=2806553 RepID=A0ABX7T9B9_9SPHN|nr:glycerate kinase [Parasphingorhabdus cellanae]QTD57618.1 glycerate kinase [Parasphingorhabdus cellanae]